MMSGNRDKLMRDKFGHAVRRVADGECPADPKKQIYVDRDMPAFDWGDCTHSSQPSRRTGTKHRRSPQQYPEDGCCLRRSNPSALFQPIVAASGPSLKDMLADYEKKQSQSDVKVGIPQVCAALRAWASLGNLPSVAIPTVLSSRVEGHLLRDRLNTSGGGGCNMRGRPVASSDVLPPGIPLNEVLAWVAGALQRCDESAFPEVPVVGICDRPPAGMVGLRLGNAAVLPDDAAMRIFSFLPATHLCMVASVSKNFQDALSNEGESRDSVWRSLCMSRFDMGESLFGAPRRKPWKSIYREALLFQEVRLRGVATLFQESVRPRACSLAHTRSGGYLMRAELEDTSLTFFMEALPFFMSSRSHSNALTGAELDYAIARFLETLQGEWTMLQGAEDTELLRKDAVHHLVKLLGGDETGDTVFECFNGGGDALIDDFMAQCGLVEQFLSLFGDKARYFNNGEFDNNSSDGVPVAPPGLGSLDSGVIVVGSEHIGLLWGVERDRSSTSHSRHQV